MIKTLIKNTPFLKRAAKRAYNILHRNNAWRFRKNNTIQFADALLNNVKFEIIGKDNTITIGNNAHLYNCKFTIIGNNCRIIIGGNQTIIKNTNLWCQYNKSEIIIGDDFTMEGGQIASIEGKHIIIGNDCMISSEVNIANGDSHSILNSKTKERINKSEDIFIGNHVWITAHVKILKGSMIPSGSIVGNSSVVTKRFEKENAIYTGNPCRLIKEGIVWDRNIL